MAVCVQVQGDGSITTDGSGVEGCTGFVMVTPSEYSAMQTIFVPLSIAEGAAIGTAIMVCWAVAFCFRAIRHALETQEAPIYD